MIFRQIVHEDLGCASYLVGDERAGIAAVVDPGFDVREYQRMARFLGVAVQHVLETHVHGDHVSGHGQLTSALGARTHIHRGADVSYDHDSFDDDWELRLGALLVRAIHTPGHRPEHTAFSLVDTTRSEEPWAVLTGDSLHVGDVARPDPTDDLVAAARLGFRSLHRRLLTLPDACEVWPAHVGTTASDARGLSLKSSSTIGYERRSNPLLTVDEDEFVASVRNDRRAHAPTVERISELNRGPLLLSGTSDLQPLTPRQLERHQADGATLVDVRTDTQFDDAHVPGAICIPATRAGFGSTLTWVADPDRPVVLIGRDDEEARHAGRLASAVGTSHLSGYLEGGMTSWHQERRTVDRIERLDINQLPRRSDEDPTMQILDVRESSRWAAGHIRRSINTPWHQIRSVPHGVDGTATVAVICDDGHRAAVAAGLLQRAGVRSVVHVVAGGVPRWEHMGRALVTPSDGVPGG